MERKDYRWQFTDEEKAIIENLKQAEDSDLRQREENLKSVITQVLQDANDDRVNSDEVSCWLSEVLNHRWPLRKLSWVEKELNATEDYYHGDDPNTSVLLRNVGAVEREKLYQGDISIIRREFESSLSRNVSDCNYLRELVDRCTRTKEERAADLKAKHEQYEQYIKEHEKDRR